MTNNIQELRKLTGAGVMECKRALEEARGDFDAAKRIIFERGLAKAEKRTERKTGAGLLEVYLHNGRIGVMLEIRCETDFVARGDLFRALAHELAMHISAMNPSCVDELLAQAYIRDEVLSVGQVIKNAIAKTGENIRVERFARYEL